MAAGLKMKRPGEEYVTGFCAGLVMESPYAVDICTNDESPKLK